MRVLEAATSKNNWILATSGGGVEEFDGSFRIAMSDYDWVCLATTGG